MAEFVGGGSNGSSFLSLIETYNPKTNLWSDAGSLPEDNYLAEAVFLNDKVYVIAGNTGSSFSNKVYAADLNASVEGVYDLYRKDGNGHALTLLFKRK